MDHIGADRLRRGRVSIPHARYFITLVTQKRALGLNNQSIHASILSALRRLHTEKEIELFCATIMPDHFHLVYRLGSRLSLDRVQAKFKSMTRAALEVEGLSWQKNFYDHRLRENIPVEQFVRYVYLNPYAKGLLAMDCAWPCWMLNKNYRPEFFEHLIDGIAPPQEWLKSYRKATDLIEDDMAYRP